jgi:hypothetical protein
VLRKDTAFLIRMALTLVCIFLGMQLASLWVHNLFWGLLSYMSGLVGVLEMMYYKLFIAPQSREPQE